MPQSSDPRLVELVQRALCRPVPQGVLNGSANGARNYTDLAHELQRFLVGKRRPDDAAEALRRFEALS